MLLQLPLLPFFVVVIVDADVVAAREVATIVAASDGDGTAR